MVDYFQELNALKLEVETLKQDLEKYEGQLKTTDEALEKYQQQLEEMAEEAKASKVCYQQCIHE